VELAAGIGQQLRADAEIGIDAAIPNRVHSVHLGAHAAIVPPCQRVERSASTPV
jgi:hypothetical protein